VPDDFDAWEQTTADIATSLDEAIVGANDLLHDVRKFGRIGRRERQLLEAIEKLQQRAISLQNYYQDRRDAQSPRA
jgi:hypothetical protein